MLPANKEPTLPVKEETTEERDKRRYANYMRAKKALASGLMEGLGVGDIDGHEELTRTEGGVKKTLSSDWKLRTDPVTGEQTLDQSEYTLEEEPIDGS